MIELSPSAAQEIDRIKQSHQQPDSYVQIQVKRGGCSGLIYQFSLVDSSTAVEHSNICHCLDIAIIVESDSKQWLSGLKIDFSEDLMGGGFRFYNPQALSSCGCGQSFSVDEA